MSKYSHLIEVGDAVRILAGRSIGEVGKVNDIWHNKIVVGIYAGEVAVDRDQLEPLFDLEQGIEIKLPEVAPGSALAEKVKPFGLSSEELGEFTTEFIAEAVSRVNGVGNEQYSEGSFQKFESMDLDDLLEYAEEEVLDIANYSAMMFIRLRRLRQALDEADDLGRGTEEEYEGGNITAEDFREGGDS